MEQLQGSQTSIFKFGFDEESKDHIKTIAQWATINAVVSFIGLGLSLLQFVLASGSVYSRSSFGRFGAQNGFTLFIQIALSLLLNITLYNTSVYLKRALERNENIELDKGFSNLRTYYKIYGIITIVVIVLCVLGILVFATFGVGQRY